MRLFVGLPCPPDIAIRLAALQVGVQGARWLPVEDLHLTLRFLGGTAESTARELETALTAVRGHAFDMVATGVGLYGKARSARTLWVGVEPAPELVKLQKTVVRVARQVGIDLAARRFRPHITTARLRHASVPHIQNWLTSHAGFQAHPIRVERFILYSSVLSSEGPRYTTEAVYPLEA